MKKTTGFFRTTDHIGTRFPAGRRYLSKSVSGGSLVKVCLFLFFMFFLLIDVLSFFSSVLSLNPSLYLLPTGTSFFFLSLLSPFSWFFFHSFLFLFYFFLYSNPFISLFNHCPISIIFTSYLIHLSANIFSFYFFLLIHFFYSFFLSYLLFKDY